MAESGRRVTQICLYPDQVNIMNNNSPRVFVSGPPGTGKTVLLQLKGMQWLKAGHDVHIVSTSKYSRAASYMLEHHLVQSKSRTLCVHRHGFDFTNNAEDIGTAISQLERASRDGQLCIIADEVDHR